MTEPPLDPEELHAVTDLDPEDVEDVPQEGPLPDDADERVVEPLDEVPD